MYSKTPEAGEITAPSPLWKDIWWTNVVILGTCVLLMGLLLNAFLQFIYSLIRRESGSGLTDVSETEIAVGFMPGTETNPSPMSQHLNSSIVDLKPSISKREGRGATNQEHYQFYDLGDPDYSLQTNSRSKNLRGPRPRMQSTVNDSCLTSMIRNRTHSSPALVPPPFPKMLATPSSRGSTQDEDENPNLCVNPRNNRNQEEFANNEWSSQRAKSNRTGTDYRKPKSQERTSSNIDATRSPRSPELVSAAITRPCVDDNAWLSCTKSDCGCYTTCNSSTNLYDEEISKIINKAETDPNAEGLYVEEFFDENYEDMESLTSQENGVSRSENSIR